MENEMTDPETIFLEPACCADPGVGQTWCVDEAWNDCDDGKRPTKYIRADVVDLALDAARLDERERAAMVAAEDGELMAKARDRAKAKGRDYVASHRQSDVETAERIATLIRSLPADKEGG